MNRVIAAALLVILAAGSAAAGVVKSSKTQVTFKGFGTFTIEGTEKITAERKISESVNNFKGKGLLGGLAGKALLRAGNVGEIVDLAALAQTSLDHKKKEYTVAAIEKISAEEGERAGGGRADAPEKAEDSDIKITRSEFKVADTGETATINGFACRKYLATWIAEWENTRTGEKGATNLASQVWTTPSTADIRAAMDEEAAFHRGYMRAIGLDTELLQQDVLGTSWMAMMASLSPGAQSGAAPTPDGAKVAAEMKKLQGYPIVIDGKYTATVEGGAKAQAEETGEAPPTSVGGALGRFAKRAVSKKPAAPAEPEPLLAYRIEVTGISTGAVDAAAFQVPAGYKKKG